MPVSILGLLACVMSAAADDPPSSYAKPAIVFLDSEISTRFEHYLHRKVERAKRSGADLLIIEIDSPGGEIEASLNLARYFRNLDWAHTVAYIPERALSGAAIAALGCDEIIMRPDAVFGDAGPIVMDYLEFGFRHAPEKIQTDLARQVRDLAEASGRSTGLAEAMVDKDLIVFHVCHTETGDERFMTDEEIESDGGSDRWEKTNQVLESREGKFLEVNGRRAKELGLADANVHDSSILRQRYGLSEPPQVFGREIVDMAVDGLNSPWATALLFVMGLIAVYIEFSAPGISIGGLIALLCFALFFWSRFLGGTAGWLEVVLFVSGIAFLFVEFFVLPGFGVAGISGILLMFISLIMAGQSFFVPDTTAEMATLTRTLAVVIGSFAVVVVGAIMTTWYQGDIPILGRLALRPPGAIDVGAGETALLVDTRRMNFEKRIQEGDIGVASSPLRPSGVVRFGDDFCDVVSEGTFIEEGRRVKVIQISGNRMVVREIDDLI